MGLKPDPQNYPNGEKDKEYKAQLDDMKKNPHNWGLEDVAQIPGVATSHKRADEKAIAKAAAKAEAEADKLKDQ